jgi:hypothetical protein
MAAALRMDLIAVRHISRPQTQVPGDAVITSSPTKTLYSPSRT